MGLILPLTDHLGARPGAVSNACGVGITPADSCGYFSKPAFGGFRESAVGVDLHLVGYGPRHEITPQRFWRGMAEESFPARPQLVEAEIGQTRDLGLKGCVICGSS